MPKTVLKFIPLILIASILTVIILSIRKDKKVPEGILIEYADSMDQHKVVIREYGLRVDSFHIVSGSIKRDQTLSTILLAK